MNQQHLPVIKPNEQHSKAGTDKHVAPSLRHHTINIGACAKGLANRAVLTRAPTVRHDAS